MGLTEAEGRGWDSESLWLKLEGVEREVESYHKASPRYLMLRLLLHPPAAGSVSVRVSAHVTKLVPGRLSLQLCRHAPHS